MTASCCAISTGAAGARLPDSLTGSLLGVVVGLFTGRVLAVRLLLEPVIQVLRPIPRNSVDSVCDPVVRGRRNSEVFHHFARRVLSCVACHARRRDGHAIAVRGSGARAWASESTSSSIASCCRPRYPRSSPACAKGSRDRIHSGGSRRVDRRFIRSRQPDLAIASHVSHRSHARGVGTSGRARGARGFRLLAARPVVGALGLTLPAKLEIRELSISFASKSPGCTPSTRSVVSWRRARPCACSARPAAENHPCCAPSPDSSGPTRGRCSSMADW